MNKISYQSAIGFLFVFIAGGCQTAQVEETPLETNLPAANAPERDPVGTVTHGLYNGENSTTEKVNSDGSIDTYVDTSGCEWKKDQDLGRIFSPSISWKDCQGNSGSINVSSKTGSMWPLEIGSSVNIKATGKNNKAEGKWRADFSCEAVDEVQVTVPAGTFDTYKVDCTTPWRKKTYYYAPSINQNVVVTQYPKQNSNSSRYTWEFVRKETPAN